MKKNEAKEKAYIIKKIGAQKKKERTKNVEKENKEEENINLKINKE